MIIGKHLCDVTFAAGYPDAESAPARGNVAAVGAARATSRRNVSRIL